MAAALLDEAHAVTGEARCGLVEQVAALLPADGLFRRWQRDGTWREIVTRPQGRADAAGLITWDVSAGSTIARAHQHAQERGSAGRATRGRIRRARRSGPSPLPRRAGHQDPPGLRAGPETAVGGHHRQA